MKRENINGYILAGGKSSRMGENKGLMNLAGKPIVAYIIEQLQPLIQRVVIVSNNDMYRKFGLEVISDKIKNVGPAGGIFTALSHSDMEQNFIVSCDMPFIDSNAIKYILNDEKIAEIKIATVENNLQPLFGLYSKSILLEWQALIENNKMKLHDMIECFDLIKLQMENNEWFDDSLFLNINTKDDFEKALTYLKK